MIAMITIMLMTMIMIMITLMITLMMSIMTMLMITIAVLLNPFRTAVPFWGQTSQVSSSLPSKRDCSP